MTAKLHARRASVFLAMVALAGACWEAAALAQEQDALKRVPVSVARDRAELMHRIYQSTLEVMHDHYFHDDRAMVPARALEDVFEELDRQANLQSRWIAVNLRAMSIDHEPESAFEKFAAKELANGRESVERIEQGYYQRAGIIPLGQGCVGCHMGFSGKPDKKPRFAGLVIRIPVNDVSASGSPAASEGKPASGE